MKTYIYYIAFSTSHAEFSLLPPQNIVNNSPRAVGSALLNRLDTLQLTPVRLQMISKKKGTQSLRYYADCFLLIRKKVFDYFSFISSTISSILLPNAFQFWENSVLSGSSSFTLK